MNYIWLAALLAQYQRAAYYSLGSNNIQVHISWTIILAGLLFCLWILGKKTPPDHEQHRPKLCLSLNVVGLDALVA